MDIFFTTNVLLAYSIYILGVASPGPSNLAIMATAMGRGRKQALVLSLGIMLGSLFWDALAAFGLSNLLANYSYVLAALYLLFLAYKSLRSAINSNSGTISKRPLNNFLMLWVSLVDTVASSSPSFMASFKPPYV